MRDYTVDARGRATRILQAGSGPPIVWLHDTRGNLWTDAHTRLSAHYTVIAPSLPGFEDSTTLDGIDGPQDVVFWLLDFLAAHGIGRPVLLGCGLGGWMAAEFAVRYPISKLVLVNAYGLRVEGALAEDEFALIPSTLRSLVFAEPDTELALQLVPDVAPNEAALHARVAAARLAWQFPYDPKLRGRLPRVTAAALVIWGACDRLLPLAHGRAYAAGLPDARLVELDGLGHYAYLEDPARFVDALGAFLG
jgi:pimeloyl-ACP methyl ester carboxylesterase